MGSRPGISGGDPLSWSPLEPPTTPTCLIRTTPGTTWPGCGRPATRTGQSRLISCHHSPTSPNVRAVSSQPGGDAATRRLDGSTARRLAWMADAVMAGGGRNLCRTAPSLCRSSAACPRRSCRLRPLTRTSIRWAATSRPNASPLRSERAAGGGGLNTWWWLHGPAAGATLLTTLVGRPSLTSRRLRTSVPVLM